MSFEQIVDAQWGLRGNKTAAPLASAARALEARLEGYRAEDCNYDVWGSSTPTTAGARTDRPCISN